ncbi:mycofactocin biosynthesis peptidyl-dipeptidase MftE [Gordonia sp. VNK21]|uniref:mycofactocin biosynthesis peptidyl-dipeptidase MftE n=1 Tax=Gordonia sp. VNK21 TaxID=3382483 RepID=UPI0038D4FDBC
MKSVPECDEVPELSRAVWPDLVDREVSLVVPVGAIEQHGPHLPVDTDVRISETVARRALRALSGPHPFLLAPALPYGASGEHEGFPGTVSLGTEALTTVLIEYGRSACRWAGRIVFVNGHGGNGPALLAAVRRLRYEGRDAAWFPCVFPDADAHAGRTETAALLAISPSDVRADRAEAGELRPIAELLDVLRADGVAGVSPNGVLGDPAGADAATGETELAAVAAGLGRALTDWRPDENGRLR